jgi:lysophospholipase L1-like esterase
MLIAKYIPYKRLLLCSVLLLGSCGGDDFDSPVGDIVYSSGDLDLSRYVAVGDSLTAGYKDNSVYRDGQRDSFPNILAGLFAQAGGGTFSQPIVDDNLGGLLLYGTPIPNVSTRMVLKETANPLLPGAGAQAGIPTTEVSSVVSGPFNNMGVAAAKTFHLTLPGYGDISGLLASPATANPYFVRFASTPSTTILADALVQSPTFFTYWIGANDILLYSLGGASAANPGFGFSDTTDATTFAVSYTTALTALTDTGAKGLLINIGAIPDIPYFTTMLYNALPLSVDQAAAANEAYSAYNSGLTAAVSLTVITQEEADRRTIQFLEGQNPPVITDELLTDLTGINAALGRYRQATAADLLLLPLLSTDQTLSPVTGLGLFRDVNDPTSSIGVGSPLLDSEVVTPEEAATIASIIDTYNSIIEGQAAGNPNLAFVDAAALLEDLNDGDGFSYGTGTVTSTYAAGGAYSLDGVHLTAKGYAIVANAIIDELNSTFNASLPKTDPNAYSDVFFEFPAGYDFTQ